MPRPVLPNAPLVDVTVEVRFPGDLALHRHWGDMQAALRGDFPKLFVPGAEPGVSPLLQPLHVATSDEKDRVLLAVNMFGFSTRRYAGFEDFGQRFLSLYRNVFLRHFDPGTLTRIGIRYINVLPSGFVVAANSPTNLYACLRLRLEGWDSGTQTEIPALAVTKHSENFTLRMSLGPHVAAGPGPALPRALGLEGGVAFDLDCFRTVPLRTDEVEGELRKAHRIVEDTFFGLLTDEYHAFLAGEAQR